MSRIIGGIFSSLKLKAPKGDKTRPTQDAFRELVFNVLQKEMDDAIFLDLCAGSGAMGLEALSRGANKAYFVDQSNEAIRCIQENIGHLKVKEQTHVFKMDAIKALRLFLKKGLSFTHIYIDPPYEAKVHHKIYLTDLLLETIDQSTLLKPGGSLIIEEDASREECPLELKNLELKKVKVQGKSKFRYYSHSN